MFITTYLTVRCILTSPTILITFVLKVSYYITAVMFLAVACGVAFILIILE